MSQIKYRLDGGLTREQLNQIKEDAFQVLEEVGMKLSHERTIELLKEFKGIKIANGRVYFKRFLSEEYLQRIKSESKKRRNKKQDYKIAGPYNCGRILDMTTNKIRATNSKDLIDAIKLCEAMDMVRRISPVVPQDIPLKLQTLAGWKLALENGWQSRGVPTTNIEEAKWAKEMIIAAGREDYGWSLECIVSPLRFSDTTLDMMFYCLDKDIQLIKAYPGNILLAGTTCPIFCPGYFVQGIAELLGGYIVLQMIGEAEQRAQHFGMELGVEAFDMKHANVAYGTPESILMEILTAQINKHFFGNYDEYISIRTSSKEIDSQAIAEFTTAMFMATLKGIKHFVSAGSLFSDAIFSPELLIIHKEIFNYIKKITEGVEFEEEKGLSLKIIKDMIQSGEDSFLTHSSTLERYRKNLSQLTLFDSMPPEEWIQKGLSIKSKAAQIVREKINSYHFQLEEKNGRELEKIYQKACKAVNKL